MVKNGNWEFFSSFYFCKNRNQNGNLFQAIFETHQVTNNSQGCHKRGGWGAPLQFLAKQLTLYQPGGQIMPTTLLLLFRPCAGPDSTMPNSHCVIFKIVQITCHSLFQIILHTSFQKLHVKLSKTQSNKHPVSIRSRYKVIHPKHYKH